MLMLAESIKNSFLIVVLACFTIALPGTPAGSLYAHELQNITVLNAEGSEQTAFTPGDTIQYQAIFSFEGFRGKAELQGTITAENWSDTLAKKVFYPWQDNNTANWVETIPSHAAGPASVEISVSAPLQQVSAQSASFTVMPLEAEYSGSLICSSCHQDLYTGWQASGHAPHVGCEICHGPGGDHIKDLSKDSIIVDIKSELYSRCHSRNDGTDLEAQNGFIKPLQQFYEAENSPHPPAADCLTCHNPHFSPSQDKGLAIKISCRECHADKTVGLNMQHLDCEDCHMPLAVLKGTFTGHDIYRKADGRSHIYRIKAKAGPYDMFSADGTMVIEDSHGLFLSLNFACLTCHNGTEEFMMDMEAARQTHTLVHE